MVFIDLVERMLNACYSVIPRHKPAAKSIQDARLIAHRGAHNNVQGLLENTMKAFQKAQDCGCWGIEFDVHATKDDILVVNHDPTLQRLWGHDVAIAEINFKALRALEPGIPTLAEVVHTFGKKLHLFIELKRPFYSEDILVHALKDLSPITDYYLLSLDEPTFASLSQFPSESLLLVAVQNNTQAFCRLSIEKPYGGVLGSYLLFSKKRLAMLHRANQATGLGFVDSKYSLYRELNRNISWVFTNRAQEVSRCLQDLRSK